MSNMKPIDSMWFNTNEGNFGLVLGEDTITGERKIYGGICTGLDEKVDEKLILGWGNKANIGILSAMISKVIPQVPLELSIKADFLKWLLKPRARKYSPFVTYRGSAMKAEVNLQIPFDELAEFFGVDEIVIDGKPWRRTGA